MDDAQRLDALEARVFGVLVEKAMTTPDQYPLSLNATTAGCNQKSNRNPVLSAPESEVLNALNILMVHGLVGRVVPAGSRVERFRHNGQERLQLEDGPLAVLAELMMRGPQHPGELRTRASRMHELPTQDDLRAALEVLMSRGFAKRLPPAPGSRAERYVQLLSPDLHPLDEAPAAAPARPTAAVPPVATGAPSAATPPPPGEAALAGRVERLEGELGRLRRQLESLSDKLGEPLVD